MSDFQQMISALWSALNLPSPKFEMEQWVYLSVDSHQVKLEESRDGMHLLITCEAGPLSGEAYTRATQIHRILNDILAYLPTNRACVNLQERDDEAPVVVVQAVTPYMPGRTDIAMKLIEDVIFVTEGIAQQLQDNMSPYASTMIGQTSGEESIFFRP